MDRDQLLQVRRFNRAVTHRIGVISDDYLASSRPLGEARLLFEIGHDGATVRELRARLALDSGYLSRLLRTLERDRLVKSQPTASDARVRRVTLTPKGKKEWEVLNGRSTEMAASLLEQLGASQRIRLLSAMAEVERLLRASAVVIGIDDPAGEDAQFCLQAYFRELQDRFDEGFDPALTVSANANELVPPAGWFLVARLDGAPVGCGAIKMKGGIGEIKRMWVSPFMRGLGIAQRLLESLEAQAIAAGIDVLRLDTHRNLAEARKIYLRNGYTEVAAYNANPYAHYWFEKPGLQRLP